jgi:hypothetical protein
VAERLYRDTDDGESNGDVETWGKEDWPRPEMDRMNSVKRLAKLIWDEARAAAQAAAEAKLAALPRDCAGDAWVVFDPAKQTMARDLKVLGVASKHWGRGYSVYAAKLHSVNTQNISVHEAAAAAAVAVFQKYGARCSTTSKLD